MSRAVRAFRAMGTTCEVTIDAVAGADVLADLAVQRAAMLEDCWSRFRPTSELSRLNAQAGTGPVRVSEDLRCLVERMYRAWQRTQGLCDPSVLNAVRMSGYDADFGEVMAREVAELGPASLIAPASLIGTIPRPTPGMSDIAIDGNTIALPAGVGLDPGAIGKGLGADLIAEEMMAAGALGVMVNLGGDIRFAGFPGEDPAWVVSVVDERIDVAVDDRTLRWVSFDPGTSGAVATSTTLRRRWSGGPQASLRHHIIDPMTGAVADIDLVQATVIADHGWWAEAAATAALLLGPQDAPAWLDAQGLSYVLLDPDHVIEPPIGATHG